MFRLKYIVSDSKGESVYLQESYFKRGPYLVNLQMRVGGDDLKRLAAGTSIYEMWLSGVEFFEPREGSWVTEDAMEVDELFRKFERALQDGEADEYLSCFHPDYPYPELEQKFMEGKAAAWKEEGSFWSLKRETLVVSSPEASAVYSILRFPPVAGEDEGAPLRPADKPEDVFKVEFKLRKDVEGWRIIDFK